jgi:hypothetical protein
MYLAFASASRKIDDTLIPISNISPIAQISRNYTVTTSNEELIQHGFVISLNYLLAVKGQLPNIDFQGFGIGGGMLSD